MRIFSGIFVAALIAVAGAASAQDTSNAAAQAAFERGMQATVCAEAAPASSDNEADIARVRSVSMTSLLVLASPDETGYDPIARRDYCARTRLPVTIPAVHLA
jgi:hypothetical protein